MSLDQNDSSTQRPFSAERGSEKGKGEVCEGCVFVEGGGGGGGGGEEVRREKE